MKKWLFIAGVLGLFTRVLLFGFCIYKLTGNEWAGFAGALLYPAIEK